MRQVNPLDNNGDTDNRAVGAQENARADAAAQGKSTSAPSSDLSESSDVRLVWKLKGTGKAKRRQVIEGCTRGQPVFIICDANGKNCTVITEEGEEIGRLNEKDSHFYHKFVEKKPYHIYIKKIHLDPEKPRVKILLLVHNKPRFPLDTI